MRPPLRVALVVVGLAAAVYGAASLTGGWMGTPPWWDDAAVRYRSLDPVARADWFDQDSFVLIRRDGSSILVVAAGLCAAAYGARPRRRRPAPALVVVGLALSVLVVAVVALGVGFAYGLHALTRD